MSERINHPPHYGGADNPYEVIKVIEAWELDFRLGNVVKYIARAPHKGQPVEDLKKARWYLTRAIDQSAPASLPTRTVDMTVPELTEFCRRLASSDPARLAAIVRDRDQLLKERDELHQKLEERK